ncbi:MAG: sensor histidine kinase [Chlorobi bacterium]|nr:sensor histidine kinase [Chlorobiota bacterium]
MVHSSPKNIALLNALIISVIFGLAYSALFIIYDNIPVEPGILLTTFVFLLSYISINYSINKFIYARIKVIYKSIGMMTTSGKRENKHKGENRPSDVLDIVNQVVLEWGKEQQDEIENLKKGAKYRREFIGNLSHELKTPIFNIQGYISTLLEGGLEDDKINRKFLQKSEKSINRMIALVDDLEYISKLETGELKLKIEDFDLSRMVNEVYEFLEIKAAKNNTRLVLHPNSLRNINVKADKKRIRQVLINLVDNAIKYTDGENSRVTIVFYDFHDKYLIEVKDNGIGIQEASLLRVFERFYRTDSGRSRDEGGSGLGLAIVKHIIEAHQQTISVRSNEGEGTTFSFTLNKA